MLVECFHKLIPIIFRLGCLLCSSVPSSYANAVQPHRTSTSDADAIDDGDLLCPYFEQTGRCPFESKCQYAHAYLCEFCGLPKIHPSDEEQREKHIKVWDVKWFQLTLYLQHFSKLYSLLWWSFPFFSLQIICCDNFCRYVFNVFCTKYGSTQSCSSLTYYVLWGYTIIQWFNLFCTNVLSIRVNNHAVV